MDKTLGLHHAALTVSDIEESSAWYRRILGMEEEFSATAGNRSMAVLRLPGSGHAVGLVQHASGTGRAFDPTVVGLDQLAFSVTARDDLDDWVRELDDHDVDHSGIVVAAPERSTDQGAGSCAGPGLRRA